MTAIDLIKMIEGDLKKNPPVTWKEEKCVTEYLLHAFHVMRGIAMDAYKEAHPLKALSETIVSQVQVDGEFESRMKEAAPK